MKKILFVTLTLFMSYQFTVPCSHDNKCKDWQEHRRKMTKPPGGGVFLNI